MFMDMMGILYTDFRMTVDSGEGGKKDGLWGHFYCFISFYKMRGI